MNKTAVLAVKIVSDAKGATAGFDQASAKVGRLSAVGMAAKAGLLAAGAGLVALGAHAVGQAGDLEQSVGAIDTVFDASAQQMHAWAKSAAVDVGLTRNEFNELGTLIGTQLANGGTAMADLGPKTKDLIGLGADLSSMFGGTTKDAVAALSSALKGERDPIERYGVSLRQSTIDAKAAELGYKKVGGSLSAEASQAATLALIMEQTSKAHGNFARETNTLAHQQQVAQAQFDNVVTSLGTLLLPAVTAVMTFFNTYAVPVLQDVAAGAESLAQVVGGTLTEVWAKLTGPAKTAGATVAGVQRGLAGLSSWVTGRLMPALTRLGGGIATAFNKVMPVIAGIVTGITEGMAPALPVIETIFGTIGDIITGVLDLVGAYVAAVVTGITIVWEQWGPTIVGVLTTVWTAILNVIAPALDTIKAVIATVTAALRGDWSAVWTGLRDIVTGVWNTIVAALTGAVDILKTILSGAVSWIIDAGRNLVTGLWNGINDKVEWIKSKISGFVSDVVGWFKDRFGIASPSKVMAGLGRQLPAGLAVGITAAGRLVTTAWDRVTSGLAGGVRGQLPDLVALAAQVAGLLAPTAGVPALAGGGGAMVVNVTINGAVDIDAAGRQLTDILDEYARRRGVVPVNGSRR